MTAQNVEIIKQWKVKYNSIGASPVKVELFFCKGKVNFFLIMSQALASEMFYM